MPSPTPQHPVPCHYPASPWASRTFAACRKSAVGFSHMRNLGTDYLVASSSREISSGEQRENATVWRFLEAKSSTQGAEGRGYAPTRGDYAAGQGTCPPPSLGSGSTHKTPHRGVLLAQNDTLDLAHSRGLCRCKGRTSPQDKQAKKHPVGCFLRL